MRPLRLELEGLTSFPDPTVIDFTDLDLFAITGPTGAGKSSLVDAILLALFGKVPRVGNEYKQLISHGSEQLAVRLDFAAGGHRWRVARRIREKGVTQVQLERIDGDHTESLAGKVRDVEREIERILGIGYDAFTRSVVLPQGQFDQFLRGDPKDRRDILVGLLGLGLYERMRQLAGERGRDLQARAKAAAERLHQDLAHATPEQLAAAQEAMTKAAAEAQRLRERLGHLGTCREQAQILVQARGTAAKAHAAVEQVRSLLAAAEATLQRHRQQQDDFADARTDLQARLTALAFDAERARQVTTAAPLGERIARLHGRLPGLEAEATAAAKAVHSCAREGSEAAAALPKLEAAVEEERSALDGAERELEHQRLHFAAEHLRVALQQGEPCPVCQQTVTTVPKGKAAAVDEAQAGVKKLREQFARAERARDDAARVVQAAQKELPDRQGAQDAAQRRLEEVRGEAADARAELAELGIGVPEPLDPAALVRQLQAAAKAAAEQQRQHRDLTAKLQALLDDHGKLAQRIAAADAEKKVHQGALTGGEAAAKAAGAELAAAAEELAAALTEAGEEAVAVPKRPGDGDEAVVLAARLRAVQQEHAAASVRLGQSQKDVTAIEQAMAKAAELRTEHERLAREGADTQELALLLRADRFQDFVLEEAVRLLTEDGARRLRELSHDRYSLRHDGSEFLVIDHWNAGGERSVKTLSGGETFLASLALSLALAEGITGLAAREGAGAALECLFVDEGFGALDRDTLDVAVQALEALHGGHRMVGVITHLEELAERLPVRLQVENVAGRARVVVA